MAKNNRVRVTQNKTHVFKIEDLKYIEAESKRVNKTSAQVLAEAITLHREMTQKEVDNAPTERSDVTPEGQLSN